MPTYFTSPLSPLAVSSLKRSRSSRRSNSNSINTYAEFPVYAGRRCCAIAPSYQSPAGAIPPGKSFQPDYASWTAFDSRTGVAQRVDPRPKTARVCVALASLLIAVLPAATALAECRSPNDLFANPFARESAHHRPIGTGAVFADRNHPSTISLLKNGFNQISSNNGFGFNLYKSTSADPLLTVTYAGPPANIGLPVRLRVPRNAINGVKTDGVIVINDTTSNTTHEFYHWRWNNGRPTAAIHRQ